MTLTRRRFSVNLEWGPPRACNGVLHPQSERTVKGAACLVVVRSLSGQCFRLAPRGHSLWGRSVGHQHVWALACVQAYLAGVVHCFHRLALAALVSGGGAWAANALAQQFQYVYTPERQRKDLQRITDFVPDR